MQHACQGPQAHTHPSPASQTSTGGGQRCTWIASIASWSSSGSRISCSAASSVPGAGAASGDASAAAHSRGTAAPSAAPPAGVDRNSPPRLRTATTPASAASTSFAGPLGGAAAPSTAALAGGALAGAPPSPSAAPAPAPGAVGSPSARWNDIHLSFAQPPGRLPERGTGAQLTFRDLAARADLYRRGAIPNGNHATLH